MTKPGLAGEINDHNICSSQKKTLTLHILERFTLLIATTEYSQTKVSFAESSLEP